MKSLQKDMFIYIQERWILGVHGDMCTDEVKTDLLGVEHLLKHTQQELRHDAFIIVVLQRNAWLFSLKVKNDLLECSNQNTFLIRMGISGLTSSIFTPILLI